MNVSKYSDNADKFDVRQALAQIQAAQVECFQAGLDELQYAGGDSIKADLDTYKLAPAAWLTFCRYFDLPADLLPQLKAHLGNLVLKCVKAADRRSKDAPAEVRLSCGDDGRGLALTPTTLASPSNDRVVEVIAQTVPADTVSETLCARLSMTRANFELDLYTKQRAVDHRSGDVLYGGVSIRHSQAGCSPTVVLGYIHRLVCTNGMTQRVCLAAKPARTKRSRGQDKGKVVLEAIREQIRGAFDQLESRLEGIRQLTEHRPDMDELPEALRRRWSINRQIASEIAAALHNDELGRTYTEYDLVNALSRVATHSQQLARRYRRHLALAAGMFAQCHIHQCPQCGTWLSGANQYVIGLLHIRHRTERLEALIYVKLYLSRAHSAHGARRLAVTLQKGQAMRKPKPITLTLEPWPDPEPDEVYPGLVKDVNSKKQTIVVTVENMDQRMAGCLHQAHLPNCLHPGNKTHRFLLAADFGIDTVGAQIDDLRQAIGRIVGMRFVPVGDGYEIEFEEVAAKVKTQTTTKTDSTQAKDAEPADKPETASDSKDDFFSL